MIAYEELVAALDRWVTRQGGTPQSVHAPARAQGTHEAAHDAGLPSVSIAYDEPHDPDAPPSDDATHVGQSPMGAQPAQPLHEETSAEIDIGDVLADDEL